MRRNSLISASLVVVCVLVTTLVALAPSRWSPASAAPPPSSSAQPIGLSLLFTNSSMPPLTLVGQRPRYLQEIDIVADTPPSDSDQGIAPLLHNSDFASLDWTGIKLVEEDWRPVGDGTHQRQRFYRGAKWMERQSVFQVVPLDDAGSPLGPPLIALAGQDDRWLKSDDGFVRRFFVRQIATGCPSQGDTTGATFKVQGLVQLRDALHPDQARVIPPNAVRLKLSWSQQPAANRTVAVTHRSPGDLPFGYGFQPSLEVLNAPANGQYFVAGDNVQVRVTFRDGQGNRLHPPGSLPTYGQFIRGEVSSGLRYFDNFRINPTLFYALKHREGNMLLTLSGPTDRLKNSSQVLEGDGLFADQIPAATVGADGYTGLAKGIPPFGVTFGGVFDPALWDTPIPDTFTFTLPGEVLPGTYVLAIKARRDFAGEALNRATTANLQVGTVGATTFTSKTGGCNTCHSGPSQIGSILHGISDRRACFTCHARLAVEPDTPLDIRVHWVHDRSDRFRSIADIRNCGQCHLTPPSGPARGLLVNGHATGMP